MAPVLPSDVTRQLPPPPPPGTSQHAPSQHVSAATAPAPHVTWHLPPPPPPLPPRVPPHATRQCTYRSQNLRTRYGARWAVVTGGTSGIGKSLVTALARQGLNVVVLGLETRPGELDGLRAELTAAHPGVQFRVASVDFSAASPDAYLAATRQATDDIDVQVVFLNAGYMVTGLFDTVPLPKWLANVHCNATSAIALAHHFIGRLRAAHLRGCVVFTSSPANIIPSPFSVTYGATKSFVTHLATSLACEAGPEGIDVSVLHPSPTATRFYDGAHAMPTLKMFQSTAIGPDAVADVAIRGVGRSVIIDQGEAASPGGKESGCRASTLPPFPPPHSVQATTRW
jgi:short-subunit dehydrogenase